MVIFVPSKSCKKLCRFEHRHVCPANKLDSVTGEQWRFCNRRTVNHETGELGPGTLESELLTAKPPMGVHDGARVDLPCLWISSPLVSASNGALEKDRRMPTKAEHYQIVAMTVLSRGCHRHVKPQLNQYPIW